MTSDVKSCREDYRKTYKNFCMFTPRHIILEVACHLTFRKALLVNYTYDSNKIGSFFYIILEQAKDYYKPISRIAVSFDKPSDDKLTDIPAYLTITIDRPFKCHRLQDLTINIDYLIDHIFELLNDPHWEGDIIFNRFKKIQLNVSVSVNSGIKTLTENNDSDTSILSIK